MTSTYWTSTQSASGDTTTITLTTTSSIPSGASVTVTCYEDVGGDGSGATTDALGNAYDNSATATLAGGTDETTDLSGFDGGGQTNDYWLQVELAGDGSDPTLASPTLTSVDANTTATDQTAAADAGALTLASPAVTATAGVASATADVGALTLRAPAVLAGVFTEQRTADLSGTATSRVVADETGGDGQVQVGASGRAVEVDTND